MATEMSSRTRAPAIPSDFRVSSCAQTPPHCPNALPMTATGFPATAFAPNGREPQSIVFLITAGRVPLYSGDDEVNVPPARWLHGLTSLGIASASWRLVEPAHAAEEDKGECPHDDAPGTMYGVLRVDV